MAERTLKEEGALTKMRGLIFGFSITRAIAVAAELGIADRLADGPRTAAELARECGVLQHPLYRMLRALAGEGVFAEDKDGRFALNPMADVLRSDHPRSLRDWTIYMADLPYRSSMEMLHSLKTGESAFHRTFGASVFDYLSAHPEYATKLFRAMSSISAARLAGLLEAYDFSRITKLVDVGGAHGAMAAAIAKRYPSVRCTCFEILRELPDFRSSSPIVRHKPITGRHHDRRQGLAIDNGVFGDNPVLREDKGRQTVDLVCPE